ncbi:MAG: hypothetical protein R3F42_09980 [Pseudomonadota bacterium]
MNHLQRQIHRHRRYLWLLMAALCLLQVLPLHLHLHHTDHAGAGSLAHAADVHIATSPDDREHHRDAHVIDLDASSIIKSPDSDPVVPLQWLCLFTLAFMLRVRYRQVRPVTTAAPPPRPRYLAFAPQRAPPRA